MRFLATLIFGAQLSTVIARPAPAPQRLDDILGNLDLDAILAAAGQQRGAGQAGAGAGRGANGNGNVVTTISAAPLPAATSPAAVAPPAQGEAGKEEEKAGELELPGVFGTASALAGGNLKQDVLFTKGAIGAFEYEFSGPNADSLTVTENTTPAAPPTGFVAIEPNSYKVALATSKGAGLTLSKIDYIFDGTNAALAAMDLKQAQVGKLCTETNAFVIDPNLGELEFEVEENEVTLNLNKAVTAEGEWGIFLPAAAAGAVASPPAANGTAPGNATEAIASPPAAVTSPAAGNGRGNGRANGNGRGNAGAANNRGNNRNDDQEEEDDD